MDTFKLPNNVQIIEIVTPDQCNFYAGKLISSQKQHGWTVWALDCEWTVDFKCGKQRPVALIQLCHENVVLLFHISRCGFQYSLIELLQNQNIYKVGVNISGDIHKLERDFDILEYASSRGVVDLRSLATEMNITRRNSLADLSIEFLGAILPKPSSERLSDWDSPLTTEQRQYAALDALATYRIYTQMMMRAFEIIASVSLPLEPNPINTSENSIKEPNIQDSSIVEKSNVALEVQVSVPMPLPVSIPVSAVAPAPSESVAFLSAEDKSARILKHLNSVMFYKESIPIKSIINTLGARDYIDENGFSSTDDRMIKLCDIDRLSYLARTKRDDIIDSPMKVKTKVPKAKEPKPARAPRVPRVPVPTEVIDIAPYVTDTVLMHLSSLQSELTRVMSAVYGRSVGSRSDAGSINRVIIALTPSKQAAYDCLMSLRKDFLPLESSTTTAEIATGTPVGVFEEEANIGLGQVLEAIAQERGIQPGTVSSYLLEAFARGNFYTLPLLGLPFKVFQIITQAYLMVHYFRTSTTSKPIVQQVITESITVSNHTIDNVACNEITAIVTTSTTNTGTTTTADTAVSATSSATATATGQENAISVRLLYELSNFLHNLQSNIDTGLNSTVVGDHSRKRAREQEGESIEKFETKQEQQVEDALLIKVDTTEANPVTEAVSNVDQPSYSISYEEVRVTGFHLHRTLCESCANCSNEYFAAAQQARQTPCRSLDWLNQLHKSVYASSCSVNVNTVTEAVHDDETVLSNECIS